MLLLAACSQRYFYRPRAANVPLLRAHLAIINALSQKFVLIDQDAKCAAAEELATIRIAPAMDYTVSSKELIWDLCFYVTPVEIPAGILIGAFSVLGLEKITNGLSQI